jgi:hypothetical protein
MKRLSALAIFAAFLVVGCPPTPTHQPAQSADCPTVCQHLRDMSCASKTPAGAECESWLCSAHGAKLDCLAKSTTCEQAKKAQTDGCP